VNVQ